MTNLKMKVHITRFTSSVYAYLQYTVSIALYNYSIQPPCLFITVHYTVSIALYNCTIPCPCYNYNMQYPRLSTTYTMYRIHIVHTQIQAHLPRKCVARMSNGARQAGVDPVINARFNRDFFTVQISKWRINRPFFIEGIIMRFSLPRDANKFVMFRCYQELRATGASK